MINIDFPQDPSKLRFHLDRSLASTYLVAKAAKHYGPRNINVAFITAIPNPIKDDERNRSVYHIIDRIGLPNVAMRTSNEYVKNKTETEVMNAYANWIKTIDPDYDDDITEIMDLNLASLIMTINIHMGWMDQDLNPMESTDPSTYVSFFNDGGTVSQNIRGVLRLVGRSDVGARIGVWSPLQQYTDQDILESAAEEGLLDIVTMARTCDYNRPIHCGVCGNCMSRRMLFISSDIEDNTLYEYK